MGKRLGSYFEDYQTYHRTPGNKICHYVAIPMIVASVFGLLAAVPVSSAPILGSALFRIDLASALWVLAMARYFTLSIRLSIPFTFVTLAFYFIGRSIPVPVLWGVFVLGWVLQGVGHYVYEKKSPAFFKNFEHLLIGPLWVFARIARYI
jgi:uncharacterized membrane protein YGL010W